jgi:hypothetical protein
MMLVKVKEKVLGEFELSLSVLLYSQLPVSDSQYAEGDRYFKVQFRNV